MKFKEIEHKYVVGEDFAGDLHGRVVAVGIPNIPGMRRAVIAALPGRLHGAKMDLLTELRES